MSVSYKQIGYISYALKVNINAYKELREMFPEKILTREDGHKSNITYSDLEAKLTKLDPVAVSDVIGYLKDDKIVEGFRQLDYLIKN